MNHVNDQTNVCIVDLVSKNIDDKRHLFYVITKSVTSIMVYMQQIITFFSETCRLLSYPFDFWAFPNYTCKNVYYFIWIYDKGFILILALRVFVLWEINFRHAILKVQILFFFFYIWQGGKVRRFYAI